MRQLDAGRLHQTAGLPGEAVQQRGGTLNGPRVVAGAVRDPGRRQLRVAASAEREAEAQHLQRAGGGELCAGAGRRRRVEAVPSPRRVGRVAVRQQGVHGGGEACGLRTVNVRRPDVT